VSGVCGFEPTASAKVKPKAEADAIKAIEANSVAEKAIAAAKANAALKAMAVTVDALKATATLSVKVDTTTAEVKFNASMDPAAGKADVDATAIAAEAAGVKLTASTEVKLKAEADAIKSIEANSVVTVDAAEAKVKATSTAEPVSVNTAVADKAVAGAKATAALTVKVGTPPAEAKFKDSMPEANQVNFDVAAAEVNLKTEAEFITADGPEAELMDSTTVQQPTSDIDFDASKAAVDATAIAAEAAGDNPTASTEVELKAEADAIKASEANSAVTVELAFKLATLSKGL